MGRLDDDDDDDDNDDDDDDELSTTSCRTAKLVRLAGLWRFIVVVFTSEIECAAIGCCGWR